MAAYEAFRGVDAEPAVGHGGRYDELWSWYAGTWRGDPRMALLRREQPRLYANTRLLWNLSRATARLYAQTVYQGDLSTDGSILPDGTRGAIPIDAQTGSEQTDRQLVAACAELWTLWNWRQYMSLRPKFCAVLGDCLTELVDDLPRGKVLPRTVWPGYVTDLELDLVGNVKRYAIEYIVDEAARTAFGENLPAERYLYRKEVDGEAFRYYRDGRPFDYYGEGAVTPNPYGFVPAIWDRHEIVWGDRGMGAFEASLATARELNSVLSQAIDYQRKQFAAPVGVKGAALPRRGGAMAMPRAVEDDGPSPAETMNLLQMDADGEFITVAFDVGRTVEMIQVLERQLVSEQPEARFGQEILQMTQVTAPGVERALGPIISGVRQVRANMDPQTVKLHQMAIAIVGERLRQGAYPADVVAARPARYAPFAGFDLSSYGRGLLDFGIPDREVIPETPEERIQRLLSIEALREPWSMEQAGVPVEQIAAIEARRAAAGNSVNSALTGIG